MTQKQFAKECGVSIRTIQRGEAGGCWSEKTLEKVAGAITRLTRHPVNPENLKLRQS